ncbi:MAG: HAD family hydrolase [Thermotogota bacterium]
MIQYVLWDFNGTLINDVDACLRNMNNLLKKQNKKPIDLNTYRSVFTFPVINYYKRVGIIETDEAFEPIAREWMNGYYAMEKDLQIFDDTIENLESVHKMGLKQGVLSASSTKQLRRLLDKFGLTPYMDHILGLDDIYAKGKVEIGLSFIQNHHLNANQVVLIGDTLHDYEVATEMGIKCILFSGGHQSYEILSVANCTVVENLKEIFDYLAKL